MPHLALEDEKGVIEAAQEMKGLYARFNEKFLELKVAAEAEKVGSAAISPNVFVEAEKKAFAEAEKAFAAEEEDLLQKAIWQAIDEAYEVYSLQ